MDAGSLRFSSNIYLKFVLGLVEEYYMNGENLNRTVHFIRNLFDWEVNCVGKHILCLQKVKVGECDDKRMWIRNAMENSVFKIPMSCWPEKDES